MARFFWLYSKTFGHHRDRLTEGGRRVDDVERASEPGAGVVWMYTPTGGRASLGSFVWLSIMIRVADSP